MIQRYYVKIPMGKIRPFKGLKLGPPLPAAPSQDQGSLLVAAPSGFKPTHKDGEGFCDGGDLQERTQVWRAYITLEALFKKKN